MSVQANIDDASFDMLEQQVEAELLLLENEIQRTKDDTDRLLAAVEVMRGQRAVTIKQVASGVSRTAGIMQLIVTAMGGTLDQTLQQMIQLGTGTIALATAASALQGASGAGLAMGIIGVGLNAVQIISLMQAINDAEAERIQIDSQTSAAISLLNVGLSYL